MEHFARMATQLANNAQREDRRMAAALESQKLF